MNKEWFEFIGLMLGDGAIGDRSRRRGNSRGNSCLCVSLKDAQEISNKVLVPIGVKLKGYKYAENAVKFYVGADLTEKLGWSNGKIVPKPEDFTDEQLAFVLRGCFESDGGVYKQEERCLCDVKFCNMNRDLVRLVCRGLIRLGVKFSLLMSQRKGSSAYAVCVRSRNGNLSLFEEKIGFITDRKREVLSGKTF